MLPTMKDYPVGHRFYKDKGLKHVEGKLPEQLKELFQLLADSRFNGSMISAISYWLIKHPPTITKRMHEEAMDFRRKRRGLFARTRIR